MRFSLSRNAGKKSTHAPPADVPPRNIDLVESVSPAPSRTVSLQRSATVVDRSRKHAGNPDRRSIAALADRNYADGVSDGARTIPAGSSTRIQEEERIFRAAVDGSRADAGRPYIAAHEDAVATRASMSSGFDGTSFTGKLSSDSGPNIALDRWSQRRLQRLNTEQGFREQRQGSHGTLHSPTPVSDHSSGTAAFGSNSLGHHAGALQYPQMDGAAHQPHPSSVYTAPRTGQPAQPNAATAFGHQAQHHPTRSDSPRSTTAQSQDSSFQAAAQQQQSPHASIPQSDVAYSSASTRPSLQQNRRPSHPDSASISAYFAGSGPSAKAARSGPANNRQSVQNASAGSRDGTVHGAQPALPAFNAAVVPTGAPGPSSTNAIGQASSGNSANSNGTNNPSSSGSGGGSASSGGNTSNPGKAAPGQQQGEVGRVTPMPTPAAEEMAEVDVAQLVKDHKELREKYTKVKKYYFEKEDQVKQLQNSLAHQRLSQSRTSLDDSEYATRFSRLDGLVAQLAFSIRKSWKSIPHWLQSSVNKDAVVTGKQEMTAVGRAVVCCWIVDECFKRYFHPDLEPSLSMELKKIELNLRHGGPQVRYAEEEEFLTAKVINWRLATLDGLQETLRSPQCAANRSKLTDALKQGLIRTLAMHLQDPPPPDLEGGVHMIIELIVSIAIHLPLESRDVAIQYYMPGHSIVPEQMKVETGIPPLSLSIADDQHERMSNNSMTSDATDMTENTDLPKKKRSVLSALTSGNKNKASHHLGNKQAGAGGSSTSLSRPESTHGEKEPRVRLAAGIGVQIRGRGVLVKAPIFST